MMKRFALILALVMLVSMMAIGTVTAQENEKEKQI